MDKLSSLFKKKDKGKKANKNGGNVSYPSSPVYSDYSGYQAYPQSSRTPVRPPSYSSSPAKSPAYPGSSDSKADWVDSRAYASADVKGKNPCYGYSQSGDYYADSPEKSRYQGQDNKVGWVNSGEYPSGQAGDEEMERKVLEAREEASRNRKAAQAAQPPNVGGSNYHGGGHNRHHAHHGSGSHRNVQQAPSAPPPAFQDVVAPPAFGDHVKDQPMKYAQFTSINKELTDEEVKARLARVLQKYDVLFLLDDSGSMVPYFDQAKTVLAALAKEAAKYDSNGIDIHLLNNVRRSRRNIKTAENVEKIMHGLEACGRSDIGNRLQNILQQYLDIYLDDDYEIKCLNIIVITDGIPTDKIYLNEVIKELSKVLVECEAPVDQIGIQFIQIGNDASANAYLQSLDDDLFTTARRSNGKMRDVVDTVWWKEDIMVDASLMFKALVGGIDRLIDRNTVKDIEVQHSYYQVGGYRGAERGYDAHRHVYGHDENGFHYTENHWR